MTQVVSKDAIELTATTVPGGIRPANGRGSNTAFKMEFADADTAAKAGLGNQIFGVVVSDKRICLQISHQPHRPLTIKVVGHDTSVRGADACRTLSVDFARPLDTDTVASLELRLRIAS